MRPVCLQHYKPQTMKTIILSLFILLLVIGCQKDIAIGYLNVTNAMYSPDSLVVKAKLDEEEDAYQIEHKIPWQSNEMDGVEGTLPIYFQIRGINGGQPEIMNQFSIKPTGVIELPYNHTVPSGRYIIDVKVGNRDHGYTIDSAFTVIIK